MYDGLVRVLCISLGAKAGSATGDTGAGVKVLGIQIP